jgi:hypothetical protein
MGVGSETGTSHISVLYADAIFCGGTIVGSSQLPVTNDVSGTFTGSKIKSSFEECKGTVTGSFMVGTFNGQVMNSASIQGSTVKAAAMLAAPGVLTQVGTIVGSQAHGLGSAPSIVIVTPVFDFGTFGAPYQRAAAGTRDTYVSAGTTGTVQITCIV